MIGLSLLPEGHPKAFQRLPVRPSRGRYPPFSLPSGRSLGFASAAADSSPCSDSLSLRIPASKRLASPATATRRLIMQKARCHGQKRPLQPLAGMRFQGLFHSSVRGAFHLSLTVLVRYRSLAVFSLSGWSPIIRPGFLVSRVTQVPASRLPPISPTGLSPSTAGRSRPSGYRQQPRQRRSYNPGQGPKTPPVWAPPRSLAATGGIILIFFSSG